MKKTLILSAVAILLVQNSFSQVCGVSASKLGACNATPVPAGSLEFEPLFVSMWSSKYWDDSGHNLPRFESGDSIEHSTTLAFRSTYGIGKNLETGIMMSSDLTHIGVAGKYRFLNRKNNEMGLLVGYNYTRSREENSNPGPLHSHTRAAALGFTYTCWIAENLSVDADIQYQTDFDRDTNRNMFFLNADAGLYFKPGIQAIVGFSHHHGRHTDSESLNQLTTINLGASIETGDSFILVFGVPLCVYGRNEICYQGFSLAVTLLFN